MNDYKLEVLIDQSLHQWSGMRQRHSLAGIYDLNYAHQPQAIDRRASLISPISPQTPVDHGRIHYAVSREEKATYYSDEKIVLTMPEIQQPLKKEEPNRRPSHAPECVVISEQPPPVPPLPPGYADTELPARPKPRPFWKRHLLAILAIAGLIVLVIGIVVGMMGHMSARRNESKKNNAAAVAVVTNNTINSVASSGLFLNDGTTWNTHVVWQNSSGGITLQVSLDGQTFGAEQAVKLTIPPRIGSPLSATTEVDATTGVVMLNIFYLSGVNDITMSAVTCSQLTDNCNTIANCLLPTRVPASNFTGLAAVNVNNAQDWRVYYYDEDGYISELQGDNSGFDTGKPIGGLALNASSVAAVNVNSTTNNINVFYVDQLTEALFTLQFTEGLWTKPSIVSSALIDSWNPTSGLGVAYTLSQDQLHVFYTGLDMGIYEFLGSNASQTTNTSWAEQPGRNHLWAQADYVGAAISAVGWNDQARFYQVKQGDLAEGALSNTTWTEAFIDNNGRTT